MKNNKQLSAIQQLMKAFAFMYMYMYSDLENGSYVCLSVCLSKSMIYNSASYISMTAILY